ncbi:UNKNOWN [Stylonychia lemnae]|uniref:Nucleolar protein 16 n=1 Tax=Stylonychia lemnae TaxID=5949 RepID=A0A078AXE1_STYLE|nr:UNKNOWN [Stylonychia lemnae]|eukprot:CDW86839.1 UNKNOWN [Stylonychia lemnae]
MGLLSRRRKQPRIVKKKKVNGPKKISLNQLDPNIRRHWDKKKSVQENFQHMGLTYNLNPNLKYTDDGKKLLIDSQQQWNKLVQDKQKRLKKEAGLKDEEIKSEDEEVDVIEEDSYDENNDYFKDENDLNKYDLKQLRKKPKLTELFDLQSAKEFKKTGKKLSSDDASMMKQLINKYGDDFKKMFKDIKLNFMQYSKGQLKEKYRTYQQFIQQANDKKKN